MNKLNQNTSTLEEILDAVNNLPEAGGGGGGSVETCLVTVTEKMAFEYPTCFYTNTDFQMESRQMSACSFSVPKNTIMAMTLYATQHEHSGGCEQIFYYAGNAAFYITGDCSFRIR